MSTVRQVNATCKNAYLGHNRGRNVYARINGRVVRVKKVRMAKKTFEVQTLAGRWLAAKIKEVYEA